MYKELLEKNRVEEFNKIRKSENHKSIVLNNIEFKGVYNDLMLKNIIFNNSTFVNSKFNYSEFNNSKFYNSKFIDFSNIDLNIDSCIDVLLENFEKTRNQTEMRGCLLYK